MKRSLDDLAIFGGTPAFTETLHVGCPNISGRDRLLARINDLLDRRWLTNNGPFVQELEQQIASLLGVKYCVAVCNGTVALEIAIRALGLAGEVIVPSMTFVATAHAVQWLGIKPVFCDIDPSTHNMDPRLVEQLVTPSTTGIIPVHLWGRPCDVDALAAIADRHKLRLLFDAAHAFGCSHRGQMIGGFGDAEVLSFHATKFFNTFEGGAITTNNDELSVRLRLMRNFGFADFDTVVSIGTNGKMNEVSAAMGLTLLESYDELINDNHGLYQEYKHQLRRIPGLQMVTYDEIENCNYQHIVLELDDTVTQVSRDQLVAILWAENIKARRYFWPGCHRMEPYRSCLDGTDHALPHTEKLAQRLLSLPTGTALEPGDLAVICHIIRFVLEHYQSVRVRLTNQHS